MPKPQTRQEQRIYSTQEGIASMLTGGALGATAAGGKAIGLLGRGVSEAPAVYTELARRGGAALAARNLDKTAGKAADFAEGFLVPVSPGWPSAATDIGSLAKAIYERIK